MKHAPLVAVICLACATAPERQVDRQCRLQGGRFVAETHGVGGLGLASPPAPRSERPIGTGGARDLESLSHLVEGTIGLGNLGLIGKHRSPPPPPPEPEGLVLKDVQLGHGELGRGGTVDGLVHYRQYHGAKTTLQATASVAGYGWKMEVPNGGRAGFWLGCLEGRPRHIVEWTFQLRDGNGHRSNTITRSLDCTGAPLPGAPPHLEAVEVDPHDVVVGWHAGLLARFSGTHPPLQLIARSQDDRVQGWRGAPLNDRSVSLSYGLVCREDLGAHNVVWQFSVRDSYSRESNVISAGVNCGVCQ